MTAGKQYLKSLSLPVGVYVVLVIMILYSRSHQVGSFFFDAVSIDLIISAPVFYLIASRQFKTRTALVFPLIALGFSLSKLVLPTETLTIQWFAKFLLPMLELVTIGSVSFYAYQFYKEAQKNADTDGLNVIRKSCEHLFGKNVIAAALATEFAVVYYSLFTWRRMENQNQFTCYRDNNSLTLYGFLIFLILVETILFHFLFVKINIFFAWSVFGLSLYFVLQLFAHAKALRLRAIDVTDRILIRYGLAGDAEIHFNQVKSVHLISNYQQEKNSEVQRIGLLKNLEPYSVAIELKEPVTVESFYGLKKRGIVLLIPIDNPREFLAVVQNRILP